MKRKYIWLNPVVINSYPLSLLKEKVNSVGFTLVKPKQDYAEIVKNKYKDLINLSNQNQFPILDNRCPLMVDFFNHKHILGRLANIDPILIHIAKELANRDDLFDGYKYIITPCQSLKIIGINLCLPETIFMTWDEWVCKYGGLSVTNKLTNSPIPLGFFSDISSNVLSITNDNLNLSLHDISNYELVEGLYCQNGCHNGDGVLCLKK